MTTKLLQLTGTEYFTSPLTYTQQIRRRHIGRWRVSDALALLSLKSTDASGVSVNYFTEVWDVPYIFDFSDKFNQIETEVEYVTINPEAVSARIPRIPRGVKLRDETGIPYGTSDGKGGYVQSATTSDVANTSVTSVTAALPPTPKALTDRIATQADAAGFLQKATFGPTLAEIDALVTLGSKRAWVADQFTRSLRKRYLDYVYIDYAEQDFTEFSNAPATDNSIVTGLLVDEAALRTKATWALSKLFVISHPGGAFDDAGTPYNFVSWFDRLDKYVFGNWRDLIESITYSLHMSRMLTYYANEKATGNRQPDENYAREIMQLFTIGLWELNQDGTRKLDENGQPIPTYVNDDIRQMARCLTGLTRWDFNNTSERYDDTGAGSRNKAVAGFNTPAGVWHFSDPDRRLRHYLPFYEYGSKYALKGRVDIPAGTDPVTNLNMMHDALFYHPNTAPFFAIRMIQHLVTSNPSPAYVSRVAAAFDDNGFGVRGDMKAVWMAILTDPEAAYDGRYEAGFGRVRDGFDLFAAHIRSLGRRTNAGRIAIASNDSVYTYMENYGSTAPRMAPSIFGFYDPTHSPQELRERSLLAPEMMMWSDVLTVRCLNHLAAMQGAHEPRDTPTASTSISDYTMLPLTGTVDALVQRIDVLLCGGKMSPGTRALVNSVITGLPVSNTTEQYNRATLALELVVNSPDFWVQL